MSEEVKVPVVECDRCHKPIEEVAFVHIQPTILLQRFFTQTPPIFKCAEHAENFSVGMNFHPNCWMNELRAHKVKIHDMAEVAKKYLGQQKEEKTKKPKGK
jgi:hypothetical protein